MTFMVCLFQNLFSPLCGFMFFMVVLLKLREKNFVTYLFY
jgi:hypothetical protein